ncbi:hypothetical protein J4Q44_G00139860 [Coregonus suidteri]|uniref:Uncharacterized protein n=1 Tax=Coregonus suidteri TaxID=861788 RepID=A0AAN8R7H6_9TELE
MYYFFYFLLLTYFFFYIYIYLSDLAVRMVADHVCEKWLATALWCQNVCSVYGMMILFLLTRSNVYFFGQAQVNSTPIGNVIVTSLLFTSFQFSFLVFIWLILVQ